MPANINNYEEFKNALVDAGDQIIVIDYTADWCQPCKNMDPKFDQMETEFTNIKFYKLDIEKVSDVAQQAGVDAYPTYKFYKNFEEIDNTEVVGSDEQKLR